MMVLKYWKSFEAFSDMNAINILGKYQLYLVVPFFVLPILCYGTLALRNQMFSFLYCLKFQKEDIDEKYELKKPELVMFLTIAQTGNSHLTWFLHHNCLI